MTTPHWNRARFVAQLMVTGVAGRVPRWLRRWWIGEPTRPRRLASTVHQMLGGLRGGGLSTLPCHGVLSGCRMTVDWARHRPYVYGSWEPAVVEAMRHAVPAGGTVLDVGAHIGFYTLILSRLVGPEGLVVALEPLPENRALLEANVRLNGCHNVRVLGLAAGQSSGTASLATSEDGLYPATGSLCTAGSRVASVPVTTLDEVASTHAEAIDFIKLDVEGAENAVLAGASHLIRARRPAMIVEVHGDAGETERMMSFLERSDYRVRVLGKCGYLTHVFAE